MRKHNQNTFTHKEISTISTTTTELITALRTKNLNISFSNNYTSPHKMPHNSLDMLIYHKSKGLDKSVDPKGVISILLRQDKKPIFHIFSKEKRGGQMYIN